MTSKTFFIGGAQDGLRWYLDEHPPTLTFPAKQELTHRLDSSGKPEPQDIKLETYRLAPELRLGSADGTFMHRRRFYMAESWIKRYGNTIEGLLAMIDRGR
jgi:hypothetical protein